MTQLEQKLFDELESLEKERVEESERLKSLAKTYEESLEKVTSALLESYKMSLIDILRQEAKIGESESGLLLDYLRRMIEKQDRIIRLLQDKPTSEAYGEQLEQLLAIFSAKLEKAYSDSNNRLLEDLKASLKPLEVG
jgi:hypothetical protein